MATTPIAPTTTTGTTPTDEELAEETLVKMFASKILMDVMNEFFSEMNEEEQ